MTPNSKFSFISDVFLDFNCAQHAFPGSEHYDIEAEDDELEGNCREVDKLILAVTEHLHLKTLMR
jgi:hypothetical protein